MSANFNADIARKLFGSLDQIHLVYIHPDLAGGARGHYFGTDVEQALDEAEKVNGNGFNIYWTVNHVRPGMNAKPAKSDMQGARFVHVDIDPPKTGGAFDKNIITASLAGLELPPSFVIDSGGGLQAFWRLADACKNLEAIEAINTQVRDWFEADACQNIDRLMRVPGSVNYPNRAKKARGRIACLSGYAIEDAGEIYEPEDLQAFFPVATRTASAPVRTGTAMPQDIDLLLPNDLGLSSLDPIRLAIETPPGADRSGDGIAVARLMANTGHTDVQIMGVLINPANAVAAHFLDQRDPRRAAARAIQLVRIDSPDEGETLHIPMMSGEQWEIFVANCKAKVRRVMDITSDDHPAKPVSGEPDWLVALGNNGIAQFVRHVVATAPSPQPMITLGAAIAMFGAIAGRRYASPTDLRTNIYSIGICDSAGGKDHPLRSITRLMTAAGLANHVGGSKIASGQAMITDLTKSPNIIYPLDEVGFLFQHAAARNRAPKHVTDIIDNLTEFYPMANTTFLGTSYADQTEKNGKPRQVIEEPCLAMFGVATPASFWGGLSSANVMDGSLARMLIFQTDMNYPDANHDAARTPFPDEIINLVQAIDRGAEGHETFPIGQGPAQRPRAYTVPYADERAAMFAREMRDRQIKMAREHEGENITPIIGRLAEHAAKLALIKAVVDNPAQPRIALADLEWGMKIARVSVDALIRAIRGQVADTAYETDLKRIHKVVCDAGSAGIDGTSLSKETSFAKTRERNEILAHLAESNMIRIMEVPQPSGKPGRPKKIYFDIS